MSNIGLELALRDRGIELVRAPVGDKYVMEEMQKRGLALGGEQSGHIIFADHLFTGDGIGTALQVLRIMAATGQGARRAGRRSSSRIRRCSSTCACASASDITDRCPRSPTRSQRVEEPPRRPGPTADPLLRHRAAAAHHARGQGRRARFERGRTRSPTPSGQSWGRQRRKPPRPQGTFAVRGKRQNRFRGTETRRNCPGKSLRLCVSVASS